MVIAILEQFKPPEKEKAFPLEDTTDTVPYYKYIIIAMTIVPAVLCLIGLASIAKTTYGRQSRANSVVSRANSIVSKA